MDPVRTCALCPKLCRFACPPASACGDENAVPTSIAAWIVLRDAGTLTADAASTHPLYRCTGCLGCQVPCEFDIDVPAFLGPERERAWKAGHVADRVREVADRVAAGEPPDETAGHHRELTGPRFAGQGIVYWPGCALVGLDPGAVERTRALLEERLEQPVGLPAEATPACCGDPLRAAGDRSRATGHRATLAQALRGASRVITGCACCLEALPAGAQHVIDVLGFQWPAGDVRGPVAFHDPCHLARPTDRGGAPRALLAASSGASVEEFVDRGVETGCCGAGDSFGLFFPEDGLAVARFRLRDPAVERSTAVVTACSRCAAQLARSQPAGPPVYDLADYLARSRG
ncbi:MAG: (Fe-S)-binding protein [Myxococcota bacterium]|jgi:Fe-S oxidoreductase|nr:(Fe-S)-binding protein [Myxococcota bacterium]